MSTKRSTLAVLTLAALSWFLLAASSALAGPPSHPALPALDIPGLNHACGTAVDSEGDTYVSSAGESKVKVYSPSHTELASIANANEPCGLAVDTKGALYVSEKATGNVVKYLPSAYPLTGAPTYGGPTVVDASGNAKGIAVDPFDDRLYVAEGTRIASFQADGTTGQDEIQSMSVDTGVTGGTYTLSFESQATAPIPYDAKPPQVQAALEALPAIGAGNVSVEEGQRGSRSFLITFTHALGSKDVQALSADSSGLSGGSASFPLDAFFQQGFEFDGLIGEGELTNATAVAAYTYGAVGESQQRYLFAADSASDEVAVFSGSGIKTLEAKAPIDGKAVPDSPACPDCSEGFGFGAGGAALAADWSNGHLFAYDAEHGALDEFQADGLYLDQVASPSLADAGPSGIAVLPGRSAMQEIHTWVPAGSGSFKLGYEGAETAPIAFNANAATVQAALEALAGIGAGNVSVRKKEFQGGIYLVRFTGALAERRVGKITVDGAALTAPPSGSVQLTTRRQPGAGPGRVYLSSGAGPGAKLLAFAGLAAPSRAPLPPLSRKAKSATAVAVDPQGYVYFAAGLTVHVYDPSGAEVASFEDAKNPYELAADSAGNVYARDAIETSSSKFEVTYYAPSSYPPTATTTYTRHEPPLVAVGGMEGGGSAEAIAVDPSNDHLFAAGNGFSPPSFSRSVVLEFDSVAHGSAPLGEFAPSIHFPVHPRGIAVYGDTGAVYVAEDSNDISIVNAAGTKRIARISGAGSPNGPLHTTPLAIDQSNGHLLAFSQDDRAVQEFDASGAFVAEFGAFTSRSVGARLAIDNSAGPSRGNLYVAYDDPAPGSFDLTAFGPLSYGEPPLAQTGLASGLAGGGATLGGSVNPNGFDLSGCEFEYLPDSQYLANGEAFTGAQGAPCVPGIAEIGHGNGPVAVHADISGLDPEGRYRFRLVAENKFGPSEGEAILFGPPVPVTKPALPILYTEATLRGNLDPSGLATKYHFEYGKGAGEYGQSTPVTELPPAAAPSEVKAEVTGLAENTTYHFRLVAESEAGAVAGAGQALHTLTQRPPEACPNSEYRTGLSANLAECRAYELITPAETNGLTPYAAGSGTSPGPFSHWLTTPSGPGAGESLAYFTDGTLPGFDGNGKFGAYLAQRGAGAHPAGGWSAESFDPSFRQSPTGVFSVPVTTGNAPDQLSSFWELISEEQVGGSLPDGRYLRTPAGFEPLGAGSLGSDLKAVGHYLSAGAAHIIFSSSEHLEEAAAPQGTSAIYDREAGSPSASVISVKPDGSPFEAGEGATYIASTEDGAAVLFKAAGTLYLHRGGQSIAIAEAPNTFAGIASGGGRVFYAAAASGSAPAALFACDTGAGPCAGPGSHAPAQVAASGVFLNVAADGSAAFFSSAAALTGPEENDAGQVAAAGERNLYAWEAGSEAAAFIAIAAPQDFENPGFGIPNMDLGKWAEAVGPAPEVGIAKSPTRASADGRFLLFQSHAQLSAYGNEGHGEIYRYAPAAPAGQRLLCVSCDPSGAPPSGEAQLQEVRFGTGMTFQVMIANLSADGSRAFFQSPDRLLPEDANDAVDVYGWRAQGIAGCQAPAGCLGLVSSGQGERDSVLYSASADGRDVFFRTREKLVGQDVPGSPSLYDARIGGGIPDPVAPAPCQGDACQGAGASAPALPAAASTGAGEGSAPRPPAACRKPKHRAKGRCVAKHQKRHQRRASHERGAHR